MSGQHQYLKVYEQFLALWYEYIYIVRALKIAPVDKVINTEKEIKLISIIFKGADVNLEVADKKKFHKKLVESNEIQTSYFLLFYAKAESIMSDLEPKNETWGLKMKFQKPQHFFSKPSFEEFQRVNTQAVNQIKNVRHIWVHNGGKIDDHYMRNKKEKFNELDTALDCLPEKTFFIEPVKQLLKLNIGDSFPVSLHYLAFTQIFLMDRIFLKMGAYHNFFSSDGKPSELSPAYSFEFTPSFCNS